MAEKGVHDTQAVPDIGNELTLKNLTARRISIVATRGDGADLIIPPFGERTLTPAQLNGLDHEPWVAHRLVRMVEATSHPTACATRNWSLVFALVAFTTLIVAFFFALTHRFVGAVASIGVGGAVLALLAVVIGRRRAEVWRTLRQTWAVFAVTVIAIGGPLSVFAGRPDLSDVSSEVSAWMLIAVFGSGVPAGLYFLFQRQKVSTLREAFLRDVVRLDPNVQTIEDADRAYGALLEEAYGSDSPGGLGAKLPVVLTTLLFTVLWTYGLGDPESETLLLPIENVVMYAFLGSYLFAINMLFRRYARSDLGPKAYTHIIVRSLAAMTAAWVVSQVPGVAGDSGRPTDMMLMVAFLIGVIPETGTTILQDVLRQRPALGKAIPSLREEHPLSNLDGISLYDSTHLLEAGIENIQGLAHNRIVDLILWTRVPTPRLVDFVDQAILYLHVRGPASADDDEDALALLRRHGIRTATDLERAYAMARARGPREEERFLALLDYEGNPVHRLRVVLDAMEDDEWLGHVRNWRELHSAEGIVRSVTEFIETSSEAASSVVKTSPPRRTNEAQPLAANPEQPPESTPLAGAPAAA